MAKKFRDLVANWSPERVAATEVLALELLRKMPLTELLHARGVASADLAAALGVTEARLSRLEQRSGLYLGTLRRLVEAMGGELEITARFPDTAIRLGELRVSDPDPVPVHV